MIDGMASTDGVAISAISCWEVAKLVEKGRLVLTRPIEQWMPVALSAPGLVLLPLSPAIAVESTKLPGAFHKDPADQIIVATSRLHALPLATCDGLIRNYQGVVLAAI